MQNLCIQLFCKTHIATSSQRTVLASSQQFGIKSILNFVYFSFCCSCCNCFIVISSFSCASVRINQTHMRTQYESDHSNKRHLHLQRERKRCGESSTAHEILYSINYCDTWPNQWHNFQLNQIFYA